MHDGVLRLPRPSRVLRTSGLRHRRCRRQPGQGGCSAGWAEYELPFDLLSDPDHEIARAYGAYGEKKNYGKVYEGVIRSTFLIDDGTIQDAFYNVRAKGHAERIASASGAA